VFAQNMSIYGSPLKTFNGFVTVGKLNVIELNFVTESPTFCGFRRRCEQLIERGIFFLQTGISRSLPTFSDKSANRR
jgi:hypothetical protein